MRQRLKKLAIGLCAVVAIVLAGTVVTFFVWNDERVASSVSGWISGGLTGRGGPTNQAFVIRRAHWPYFGAMRSMFLGTPTPFEAWDVDIWDVDGGEVIHAPHVTGRFDVQKVVVNFVRGSLPFHSPDYEAHLRDVVVDGARGRITPLASGKVNLVTAFLPKKPRPPGEPPPPGGMRISVTGAKLHDASFAMAFPGWHGEAEHLEAELDTLAYSSFAADTEPEKPGFTYRVTKLAAPTGNLTLGQAYVFPLEDLSTSQFEALDPTRQHLSFAGRVRSRGAPATIEGRLLDCYSDHPGVDATLHFDHGAGLLAMLNAGELLAGDPRGHVRFHGPFSHTILDGAAENGEFHVARLVARNVKTLFSLDGVKLSLSKVTSDLGGGHAGGAVDIDLGTLTWSAQLRAEGVDPAKLAPLVPAAAFEVLGGRLDGTAHAAGSLAIHPERVRVKGVDARLTRRKKDQLPHAVAFRGGLGLSPEKIALHDFHVEGDGLATSFRGDIDPVRMTIDSDLAIEGHGLTALLKRAGAPPAVDRISARTHVHGPLVEPTVDGSAHATGVGMSDKRLSDVDAHVRFEHGTLTATRLHGSGFGGTVDGSVTVGLFDGSFARRIHDPRLALHVDADKLRIHTVLALPAVRGEFTGKVDLDGTFAHPHGSASLSLPAMTIYGDPYKNGTFLADLDEKGIDIRTVSLERAQRGRFTVAEHGRVGWDGSLDVKVTPSDFPLRAIPQLRDTPVPLEGTLAGSMHIGGALGNWIPQGQIKATGVKVRDVLFGSGWLAFDPVVGKDATRIKVTGEFFNRFLVEGSLTVSPQIAGDVQITFRDLSLADIVPELARLPEVKSLASGSAHVFFDVGAGLARAELRLHRLQVTFVESADEAPIEDEGASTTGGDRFVNQGDVVVETDFHSIDFRACKLRYDGMEEGKFSRIGDLEIAGRLDPVASHLTVKGGFELRFVEYFASRWFQHTHGRASADLTISGAMLHPQLDGVLALKEAQVQPRGADRLFVLPEGTLRFGPGGVALENLRARLDQAEAVASGTMEVAWPTWSFGKLDLRLRGEVSSTLLAWIYPDQVSETAGRFQVQLDVGGTFSQPKWSGRVDVDDVAFHEKRLARDVRLPGGSLVVQSAEGAPGFDVIAGCPRHTPQAAPRGCKTLRARIDEASDLALDGTMNFGGSLLSPTLSRLALHVDGDNIEWGSPGVFSITVSPHVQLTGSGEALKLSGHVNLVTGRYYQNFDVKDLVIQPRTIEHDPPFYKGIPLLEDMELELTASSSGPLLIKDNLADLSVSIPSLEITGTLGEPTLGGTVYVEPGGRFSIPFLRSEFISEQGAITFEEELSFPNDTPRLEIRAGSDVTDRYDQIHHLNLVVRGTYREPDLDLSSNDGWDKAQTLYYLVTGGTPDDFRRAAVEPTATNRTGGGVNDGYLKVVTGRALQPIENPLLDVTRFDVVRLELGYDSVYIKLCPYNRAALKLCGTGDLGFTGAPRYDARGELKLSDHFSVVGSAEHLEHGPDTSEDVLNRFKLQLSLRRPIF